MTGAPMETMPATTFESVGGLFVFLVLALGALKILAWWQLWLGPR